MIACAWLFGAFFRSRSSCFLLSGSKVGTPSFFPKKLVSEKKELDFFCNCESRFISICLNLEWSSDKVRFACVKKKVC